MTVPLKALPHQFCSQNSIKWLTVSSRHAITHKIAKELASIISPLVGHSPHHIRKTQHFMDHIKSIQLQQGECMVSCGVKALFTSVLVNLAISIFRNELQQDPLPPKRTSMSIIQIITLLEFCLKDTYLLFQGMYFEQVHGASMGSPIIPLIANLFM